MPFSDQASSPSTTHGSYSHHSSQDAHDYTRLRLHREMVRDLDRPSYATSTGEHEEDDTVGTFDIENGAAAMSTRRFSQILPQNSPSVIESKYLNTHFQDFTMGQLGLTDTEGEDSIEIGRFHTANSREDKSSSLPISIGRSSPPVKTSQNQPSNLRYSNTNSENQNNRRASRQPSFAASQGSPSQHRSANSKTNNTGKRVMSSNSNQRYQPSIETDEESMLDTKRPNGSVNTRFTGQVKDANTARREFSAAKNQEATEQLRAAAQEANLLPGRRPAAALMTEKNIPTGYTTQDQFLKDLGLKALPTTQAKPVTNSKPSPFRAASKPANPNLTAMSFRLPDMTGISDLVSSCNGNNTSLFTKGGLKNHLPLESIPLPQDEKAILLALSLLQEKVADLETTKAKDDEKISMMESEYDRMKQMYLIEQQNRRSAEVELEQRKRSDSALGSEGSERGGSSDWLEEKQRLLNKFTIERMKLEGQLYTQQRSMDGVKIELTKAQQSEANLSFRLEKAIDERASAINTLAATQSSNDNLRKENKNLKVELTRYRAKVEQVEVALSDERQSATAKINRYREKVKRMNKTAADATETARDVAQLLKDSREAYTKSRPMKARVVSEPVVRSNNMANPRERSADGRVQHQVERLEKDFKKTSQAAPNHSEALNARQQKINTAPKPPSVAEEPAPVEEPAAMTRPKTRRKRIVFQEVSETESENDTELEHADYEDQYEIAVPQHNDTTFTDAEDGSQHDGDDERVVNDTYEMRQDTVLSMVDPAEVAQLRQQIQQERQLQEEAAEMRAADAAMKENARPPQRHDNIGLRMGGQRPNRVFVYSPVDDVTIVTAQDDEEDENATERFNYQSVQEQGHDVFGPANSKSACFEEQQTEDIQPSAEILDNAQDVINKLGTHEKDQCTVCRRKADIEECNIKGHSGNVVFATEHHDEVPVPEIIPVSKRMPQVQMDMGWEEEATMRPSQAPKIALEKVVQQIQDEFNHLKMDYQSAQAAFLNLDPSLGKRKRKAMTVKMNDMVEEMDKKADQIYALYDVAELVRADDQVDMDDSISQIDVDGPERDRERRRSETRRARHASSVAV